MIVMTGTGADEGGAQAALIHAMHRPACSPTTRPDARPHGGGVVRRTRQNAALRQGRTVSDLRGYRRPRPGHRHQVNT